MGDNDDISKAEGLLKLLIPGNGGSKSFANLPTGPERQLMGSYFCSHCRRTCRHYVYTQAARSDLWQDGRGLHRTHHLMKMMPSVYVYECLECDTKNYATLMLIESEPTLSIRSEVEGGIRTDHTPPAVAYYLDEANRAQKAGAKSAAAAMYRAALEQILFEQGFVNGMLKAKIDDLGSRLAAGTAPDWAKQSHKELFTLLKNIGDGSIHPNGGEISKQLEIDEELLSVIEVVLDRLLTAIYERPVIEEKERLRLVRAAETLVKPKAK